MTTTYRNYLLAVLLLILASNYMDRLALGILLQDIKIDLALSDTQLGFLTGIAFTLFYSIMGIPIGRWADRGNRITIIATTTALWSIAVALCGAASSFLQLLLIRVGVAVGEAGCIPPAHSLIADHFTRSERPRAVAIYMLGGPLSLMVGYYLAGALNELYGWRTTFTLIGLPGLGLAAAAWLTLREPRRVESSRHSPRVSTGDSGVQIGTGQGLTAEPRLLEVFTTLWNNITFRHLLICNSVLFFFGYGILQWQPAFFIRSFGLGTAELGEWFAVIYGLGGLGGTYLGGALASRRAAHNEPLQLRAMSIVYSSFAFISAGVYLSRNLYLAFALLTLASVGISMAAGPLFATIQTLVPSRMRAMSIALIYFLANLVGMGLGPLAAGLMSDALRPQFGEESLRYALLALCPGYLWAGWHLWSASKTVLSDLSRAQLNLECAATGNGGVVHSLHQ